MKEKIVHTLSWVKQLVTLPASERKRVFHEVMESLSEYSHRGEGSKDRSAGRKLLQALKGMKFIGFVPNIQYVKRDGAQDELEALFVHPFGTETLLFKHPDLPLLLIANPNIRFNKSFLTEMKLNSPDDGLQGISG